ncbi:unnamed protein product [Symbiodinium sp. CCMP2592]|nr:unnamed protein product [Symbiodinium sp. CCMP2592]
MTNLALTGLLVLLWTAEASSNPGIFDDRNRSRPPSIRGAGGAPGGLKTWQKEAEQVQDVQNPPSAPARRLSRSRTSVPLTSTSSSSPDEDCPLRDVVGRCSSRRKDFTTFGHMMRGSRDLTREERLAAGKTVADTFTGATTNVLAVSDRLSPYMGLVGFVAGIVLDEFMPDPDYVTRDDVLDMLDDFGEELKQEMRTEMKALVSASIDANSFQEVKIRVRKFIADVILQQAGNALDGDAFVSYCLNFEPELASLAQLLFLPCTEHGWGSMDCHTRLTAGAPVILSNLVPIHFAILDAVLQAAKDKLVLAKQQILDDNIAAWSALANSTLGYNFRRIGCPNSQPSDTAKEDMKSRASDGNPLLSVMSGYCEDTASLYADSATAPTGDATTCDVQSGVGPGWKLVRRTVGSSFPQTDQLEGTVTEGTAGGPLGPAFSKSWSSDPLLSDFDEFLFATGDCKKFMIMDRNQVLDTYSGEDREILRSHSSWTQYKAKMYRRVGETEDPWITFEDHFDENNVGGCTSLYVGDSYVHPTACKPLHWDHKGLNVFVRNRSRAARECCGGGRASCQVQCKPAPNSDITLELYDTMKRRYDKALATYRSLYYKSRDAYLSLRIEMFACNDDGCWDTGRPGASDIPGDVVEGKNEIYKNAMSLFATTEALLSSRQGYHATPKAKADGSWQVERKFPSEFKYARVIGFNNERDRRATKLGIEKENAPGDWQTSEEPPRDLGINVASAGSLSTDFSAPASWTFSLRPADNGMELLVKNAWEEAEDNKVTVKTVCPWRCSPFTSCRADCSDPTVTCKCVGIYSFLDCSGATLKEDTDDCTFESTYHTTFDSMLVEVQEKSFQEQRNMLDWPASGIESQDGPLKYSGGCEVQSDGRDSVMKCSGGQIGGELINPSDALMGLAHGPSLRV